MRSWDGRRPRTTSAIKYIPAPATTETPSQTTRSSNRASAHQPTERCKGKQHDDHRRVRKDDAQQQHSPAGTMAHDVGASQAPVQQDRIEQRGKGGGGCQGHVRARETDPSQVPGGRRPEQEVDHQRDDADTHRRTSIFPGKKGRCQDLDEGEAHEPGRIRLQGQRGHVGRRCDRIRRHETA